MKKSLKLFITICVVLVAFAITASAATDFTGYTAISSEEELLELMNSTSAISGKYYLTKDLDLTGKTQSPIGEPDGKQFGTNESISIFDGNGHTVKGVNISGGAYAGFFGVVDNVEIRNLTLEGKISGANNCGGIVAYAKTRIVIENCVNKCSVESSGINVGGIIGCNETLQANPIKLIKISNCTNEGTIKATRVVGGIVGVVQRITGCEVVIEKCTNNGNVTATSTSSETKIGGILGASNRGEQGYIIDSFTISKCLNTADITGYYTVGGIAGEFFGTDNSSSARYESAKYHVSECMNSGEITSTVSGSGTHSYVGGIIGRGSQVGDIVDCLNIGDIYAKVDYAGGIFGYFGNDFLGAKNNLNRAAVYLNNVAVTDKDYVNSVGGFLPYKPYGVNYYMGTIQVKKVWKNTTTGATITKYNESLFQSLNASGNWVDTTEPMLKEFATVSCGHNNVTFIASGNSIVFKCSACEKELYTDTSVITEVIVNYDSGIAVSEGKDIGTAAAPFKSVKEAFEYIAVASTIKSTELKITISGKAVLEDTYETPTLDKTITVTGGTFHYGGAKIANRHLNLGGPMVFENITFTSFATEARINAQNNKLVMGEGIVMANASSTAKTNDALPFAVNNVKMFVSGGFYEDIPDTMATDVTIRSGEYYVVSGWNYTNSTDATKGTSKLTVGKTKASDTLKICDLVAFTTVAQTRLTDDSTATIIIDGDADIGRLMMSEREKTSNAVEANYITNVILRGAISKDYRNAYQAPYGFDITGGSHAEASLGYHTFRIFTDARVDGAVLAEHAFFGGDGYTADETLTTGGYKPVSAGGDVTMTQHTYMEYCVSYLGGHTDSDDEDTLCDECGADTACAHANAVPVVGREPNCTVAGYEYTFCDDCGQMVNERELPLDLTAHEYVWEAYGDGYRYVCVHNASHIRITVTATNKFYVSDKGNAEGGFTASNPSNDFDTVMKLAAACGEEATVYVIGKITLKENDETSYEVYVEPEHSNTITVRGYKDASGIIEMGSRNTRLEYVLSGDTTFEQIEFATGITKNALYIVARHNHLVMGENISTNFGAYSGDSTANGGKVILIGGCDNMVDSSSCSETCTNLSIKSGTYYMIIGGSSLKPCGLENGTVNIEVLGDITVGGVVTNKNGFVDRQFILGSHSADVGNIVFTLDGDVTCTNAFCLGSYGVNGTDCRTAGDVSIVLKSGSINDYSFPGRSQNIFFYNDEFAETYDPTAGALETATLVIFPIGNSHSHAIRGGIMNYVESVTVSYNADEYSTVELAERFRVSLGGSDKFTLDVLPETPCTSKNGLHTANGAGTVVLEETCYGEGSIKYTCATCGEEYTEIIARLPHAPLAEELFSEANCHSPAIYVSVCGNDGCGQKHYSSVGSPTYVHEFEDGVCKYCNHSKQDVCEHTNLSAEDEFVNGCGIGTKQVCLDCDKEFINIESANHNFGKYTITVEPTTEYHGVKVRKCRSCGKEETAIIYADGTSAYDSAMAINKDGSLSDVSIDNLKLTKAEKAALDALLQDGAYGSEVKVSYKVNGDTVTDITYSIPLPKEYADMYNLKIVVKDDDGTLHYVDFEIEKGYIVFKY